MQWLELVVFIQAGASFVLSSSNALYFVDYCRRSQLPARRVGAVALAGVSLGLAAEALTFLLLSADVSLLPGKDSLRETAVLVVRSLLLLSTAFISLLVWRQGRARRG